MTLFFDIETNGLLDEMTRVVCLSYSINGNDPVTVHDPEGIVEVIQEMERADKVVGHNILGFDIPALEKIFGPIDFKGCVRDTLVMSRLAYPEIRNAEIKTEAASIPVPTALTNSHSLEAWGYRLGMHKDSFLSTEADFANLKYSEDLRLYCEQDVRVTVALFEWLDGLKFLNPDSVVLEHDFAQCIANQIRNGFEFDVKAASVLYASLCEIRDGLTDRLRDIVPPTEIKLKTKVKYLPFNPSSRQQIAVALKNLCNWEPTEFTPSGEAKVDETVLNSVDHPIAKMLVQYLTIVKRIGMLAEGEEAWLKVEKNGRIYGYVNHNGAVTGRCTHRGPNMAQVPASHSPYGKECRALFTARPGYSLVGVDASGLELRCLAHYMARHDDGEYAKEILTGDIHTKNQHAAGLATRDQAKVFIYAFLYGAGPAKLGSIVGGGYPEGQALKSRFLKKIPALKALQDDIVMALEHRGFLIGIDGRALNARSQHSALNTLLQSAGAIVMKQATVLMNRHLTNAGIDFRQVAHIHDEVQFEVRSDQARSAASIVQEAIPEAGDVLGFRCPLAGEARVGKDWSETH
jgi:DNA polymerase-1